MKECKECGKADPKIVSNGWAADLCPDCRKAKHASMKWTKEQREQERLLRASETVLKSDLRKIKVPTLASHAEALLEAARVADAKVVEMHSTRVKAETARGEVRSALAVLAAKTETVRRALVISAKELNG